MQEDLNPLLNVQELDIKMIRLMSIKKQRHNELQQIQSVHDELNEQLELKTHDIKKCSQEITTLENTIQELTKKYKTLEGHQSTVKKVEEFNSLTREMSNLDRERQRLETETSNTLDKKTAEEELLEKIKDALNASTVNNTELRNEINKSIEQINNEGKNLKKQRDKIAITCNPEILQLYERLLRNKKDRVIVPIENRSCSGCHITLTLQHENLVRKGGMLIFCEHCSRVHYWKEHASSDSKPTTRRRRRTTQS